MPRSLLPLVPMLLIAAAVVADEPAMSTTVMGPRNINLHDGAVYLKSGDANKGVSFTLKGLESAKSLNERKIAHSNLCAGYLMLNELSTALVHCNWVLDRDPKHWRTYNNRALVYMALKQFDKAEADIEKGQDLNPRSEKLKEVKGIYLDQVAPVDANILIDDRRSEQADVEDNGK